jgi:regulator of cell morphogenesis and NO signaling
MTITKEEIVNNVIKEHPSTIEVFTRFAIDSCCGGAASIEASAKRDGAELDSLMDALNKAAAAS